MDNTIPADAATTGLSSEKKNNSSTEPSQTSAAENEEKVHVETVAEKAPHKQVRHQVQHPPGHEARHHEHAEEHRIEQITGIDPVYFEYPPGPGTREVQHTGIPGIQGAGRTF